MWGKKDKLEPAVFPVASGCKMKQMWGEKYLEPPRRV